MFFHNEIFLLTIDRVAYRRLFPGSEPGTTLDRITLQQACLNAVERFSPFVLQARSTDSRANRDIPEAALQDEIYCCLENLHEQREKESEAARRQLMEEVEQDRKDLHQQM